ncbi:MAG TPA: N-acetyltransferase [Candidatus Omnitrophota bacterium]|nr:N-acetyltransferase [Candidatus Omnitrophota bacterium]HQO57694.1 N-acetyltransferase [Candidatus Omnitrophota bacterium]
MILQEIVVRGEQAQDIAGIREVNQAAFGQAQEGRIVDVLRNNCRDILSLVAVLQGRVVGHILFSPVSLSTKERTVTGVGLAPMAVLPEFQRMGVGTTLVRTGIFSLRARACPFIIVLGQSRYYSRFGFEKASAYHIESEWDIPEEAFLIMILDSIAMKGMQGTARYRPEFSETV